MILAIGAFAEAFGTAGFRLPLFAGRDLFYWGVLGLLPLAAFAGALQLLISTYCRTVKEAQTYLSLLVFLPMGVAMFMVVLAPQPANWIYFIPIAGQQALLSAGSRLPFVTPLPMLATGWCTAVSLHITAGLLERDEIVYGG